MAGARPNTWMPMYWPAYLADTGHLSTAEHGAYLLLIGHYWMTGKPLPDDDRQLSRIVRMAAKEWVRARSIIAAFFQVTDGVWVHGKIEAELSMAVERYTRRAEAGARGGSSKKPPMPKQTASNASSPDEAMLKHAGAPDRGRDNLQSPNGDTKTTGVVLAAATAPAAPKPETGIPVTRHVDLQTIPAALDRRKGTRLHPEWELPDEWRFWAEDEHPGVDVAFQAKKFANHWWGKSGKDATKVDWFATWRNWILNAKGYDNGKRPDPASELERAANLARQYDETHPN